MQAEDRITPLSSSIEVPPSAAAPPRKSRRASRYSSSETATAPSMAAPSTVVAAHISSKAQSAPTAAPDDRPSTNGSASGLRSSACIMTPARASAPPLTNAIKARPPRSASSVAASDSGWPRTTCMTACGRSDSATAMEPVMPAMSRLASEAHSSAAMIAPVRWRRAAEVGA